MAEEKTKVTLEQITELLPEKTSLVYVDYRDSLDEHTDLIQKCVHANNFDALYEKEDEWYGESAYQSIKDYTKQLRKDLRAKYDLSKSEAKELIEEYEDAIKDVIYSRCNDDTIKDLLRNTSGPISHYDTAYEVESGSWQWSEAEVRLERIKIKNLLSIKKSDYDAGIDMMIRQASYGGNLLVFFKMDVEDFIRNEQDPEIKSIKFKNAHIGIIDHCNGSGDCMEIPNHEFVLPYNQKNVFLEESIKYNWTYSIAGMVRNWCESTVYEFGHDDVGEVEVSTTNAHLEQEAKYNETYKEGGCTLGDMDITRHRNTSYVS